MKKYLIPTGALSILVVLVYFSLAIYIGSKAGIDTKIKSDAILILGAKAYHGSMYNPCLLFRVEHAVELYKAGYATKILVSGGNDIEDNINEADTMKKMAMEKGVPSEDILTEKEATSTYENFSLSKKIFDETDNRRLSLLPNLFI